jgi:predicted nucleic acid-binding protein
MSPDDACFRSSGLRRPRNFCGGCVNSAVGFRPDSVSIGSKRMSAAEIFFDTNVLLYLISGDPVKADEAETLISGGGVISAQVLNEFASVASRKRSLRPREIREVLSAVRAVCSLEPVTVQTHDLAFDLLERVQLSFYDALIVAAAALAKMSRPVFGGYARWPKDWRINHPKSFCRLTKSLNSQLGRVSARFCREPTPQIGGELTRVAPQIPPRPRHLLPFIFDHPLGNPPSRRE